MGRELAVISKQDAKDSKNTKGKSTAIGSITGLTKRTVTTYLPSSEFADIIPDSGKIFIVKNQIEIQHETVISNYAKTKSLKTSNLESRGWLLDTLMCVEKIPTKDFSLNQMYAFENELKVKHPENNFIKDKIRFIYECFFYLIDIFRFPCVHLIIEDLVQVVYMKILSFF